VHPAIGALNYLYLGLLLLCFTLIEVLAGGASLIYNLPCSALLVVAAFLSLASFRKSQPPANVYCLAGSALFFGYILARIVTSPVEYLTRHDLFSILSALIVYLLLAAHLTSPKHRLGLVFGLLLLGLINVSLGALQYFRHANFAFLGLLPSAEAYGARATGFYGCPDHLAGFLEVTGLIGLSVGCWGRWKHSLKIFTIYASLMCLVGVVLTGSRGGLLSVAGGFLVFVCLSVFTLQKGVMVRKWLAVGLAVAVAIAFAAGIAYFLSHQANLGLRWTNLRVKATDRLNMWDSAIQQFKLNPLVGTGSGTYLYLQRHFRSSTEWADAIYAHNDYLQLLAEYGLIGFAGFLIFLGAHVSHGIRSLRWIVAERLNSSGRVRSDTLALTVGALSAVSAYLIHSAFDFNLHIPANALLLAATFAMLANPGVEMPDAAKHYRTTRFLRLALPAFGLWIALAGLPTWPAEYFAKKARSAVGTEKNADAIKLAIKGISYDKKDPYLYLYLGEGLFGVAEAASNNQVRAEMSYKAAFHAYTNGLSLFPQDRYLLLGAGWSLDGLRRFDEAEHFFKKIVEEEPNSPQISAYYAIHLHSAGKLDEAEAEYNRSIKLYWNPAAAEGLARLTKERAATAGPPK